MGRNESTITYSENSKRSSFIASFVKYYKIKVSLCSVLCMIFFIKITCLYGDNNMHTYS